MNGVILKTENLTKHYGSLAAVKNLSLEIYEGEVFGFLGPNGAGKTTSIHMICGLLKPDSGRVWIKGQAVDNGSARVRSKVGMCPQDIVIWPRLTVFEQLQFMGQMYNLSPAVSGRNAERLIEELDLADKRNQQGRTLSGGMQRRLNIAMALVHDPEIVVFDEPEAGLDPQSRVKVRQYIQSLARRKTVILTTHNMDEADRVADRIAIIDHGELLVLDTADCLKRRLGEGDVVEIHTGDEPVNLEQMRSLLADLSQDVQYDSHGHTLSVHALDVVGRLAVILERIHAAGVRPGEVRIRTNTLEDVFIQLTGRRLRE